MRENLRDPHKSDGLNGNPCHPVRGRVVWGNRTINSVILGENKTKQGSSSLRLLPKQLDARATQKMKSHWFLSPPLSNDEAVIHDLEL